MLIYYSGLDIYGVPSAATPKINNYLCLRTLWRVTTTGPTYYNQHPKYPQDSSADMLRSLSSRQIPFSRSLATQLIPSRPINPTTRHNWRKEEIREIYDTPLLDLVFRSASVHRQHHDPSKIQLCTLMNIKSLLLFRSRSRYIFWS